MTDFIRHRARLIPYTHSVGINAHDQGTFLVEPLYYDHPKEANAYRYRNTYRFGTELLVAPITSPRHAASNLGVAEAWLPPSRWAEIFNSVVYCGDRLVRLHPPLRRVPALVKEGGIIVLDNGSFTSDCQLPAKLEIIMLLSKDGFFELVEDNGKGSSKDEISFGDGCMSAPRLRFRDGVSACTRLNPDWAIR